MSNNAPKAAQYTLLFCSTDIGLSRGRCWGVMRYEGKSGGTTHTNIWQRQSAWDTRRQKLMQSHRKANWRKY